MSGQVALYVHGAASQVDVLGSCAFVMDKEPPVAYLAG